MREEASGRHRGIRGDVVLAGVVAVSGVSTVGVASSSDLIFATRLPALHVAVETAAAIIALVAAYLVAGRFVRRRRLDDLLLAHALGAFALTNAAFGAVPAVLGSEPETPFLWWTGLCGRLIGTAGLALAAFAPARCLKPSWGPRTVPLVPAALSLVAAVVLVLAPHLPEAVEISAASSRGPQLEAHPMFLAVQLVMVALFALASMGFVRRHRSDHDEFMIWLSVAAIFGAFARVNYSLYPSIATEWVHTGDVFRLLFYTTILIAAAREVRSYWRAQVEAGVLEERRRLARDLHDGLAQELAYVKRNLRRLDRDDPVVHRLHAAASRAVVDSRRAIAALAQPLDRPLDVALAEAARDTADREGTQVALSLAHDVSVTPEQREALVRIVTEAITNAARHGGADVVRVRLETGAGVRLSIADAGRGFHPEARPEGRFGLISMRERAEAVGGSFRLKSGPGQGTQVEVTL